MRDFHGYLRCILRGLKGYACDHVHPRDCGVTCICLIGYHSYLTTCGVHLLDFYLNVADVNHVVMDSGLKLDCTEWLTTDNHCFVV